MIEKLKQLRELLSDLYVEGVIGCSPLDSNRFQMRDDKFFEMFSDSYKTARRPDNEYPFEAFVVIDGLTIFTVLTLDDFLKYVIKKEVI